jgi:hypothetical protein
MSRITVAENLVDAYFDGTYDEETGINTLVDSAIENLGEQELNSYQIFFQGKLKEFGVSSPSQLDDTQKREFFSSIKKEWKKAK